MEGWCGYAYTFRIIRALCTGSQEFWRIIGRILWRLLTTGLITESISAIQRSTSRWRRAGPSTLANCWQLWVRGVTDRKESFEKAAPGTQLDTACAPQRSGKMSVR